MASKSSHSRNVKRLHELDTSTQDAWERYPALKLRAWFGGFLKGGEVGETESRFETGRACRASRSMRGLTGVSGEMTRTWLRQWKL